jgi:hypothetical protein
MISRWYSHLDSAEAKALDEEHQRLVRISRLHVQFTEASLATDPALRKSLLQKFLADARALGAVYIRSAEGGASAFLENWRKTEGLD